MSQHLAGTVSGAIVIVLGLLLAGTGGAWQDPVTEFLTAPAWSAELVLWLPYWPFEPFFSFVLLAVGTFLLTGSARRTAPAAVST